MPTLAEVRAQFPQYQDIPDAALADALHKKFYSDMPRPDFDAKIGLAQPNAVDQGTGPVGQDQTFNDRFAASQQPPLANAAKMESGLQASAPIVRGNLLPISKNTRTGETFFDSNAGVVGSLKKAVSLPGDVAAGKFATKPEVPGMLSETDVARDRANQQALTGRALELATVASPMSAASRVSGSAVAAGVKAAKPKLQEIEAIKESARAAYKIADDVGVVVSPKSFAPAITDIARTVAKEGLDPTLHPGATAALKRLGEVMDEPVSLQTIDTLRQVVKDAAASRTPGEARIANIMIDKIDDYVSGIGVKDVVIAADNPEIATKALSAARSLWQVMKKSEAVENLVERATTRAGQFSGSGFENALRTEFRQFVMNKKNLRGFSGEEVAALKKVARGGTIDNIARMVGKFAPTGVVSSVMSGGAGAAIGGPVGAVAMPAAGFAARQYATKRTKGNVDAVRALVRGAKGEPSGSAITNTNELLDIALKRGGLLAGENALLRPNR